MSTNTQVTAYVLDISTSRLSDAEDVGGKGASIVCGSQIHWGG